MNKNANVKTVPKENITTSAMPEMPMKQPTATFILKGLLRTITSALNRKHYVNASPKEHDPKLGSSLAIEMRL